MENGKLTRTYRKWSSMWQRCTNPAHPAFGYYGGRGIKTCERWRCYDAFFADMGECPPGMWLDRIKNELGYEPGNCRWVTPTESAHNRVKKGTRKPINPNSLMQKAKRAGLPYQVVYQRINVWCWKEEKALSTPVGRKDWMRRPTTNGRHRARRTPGWTPKEQRG